MDGQQEPPPPNRPLNDEEIENYLGEGGPPLQQDPQIQLDDEAFAGGAAARDDEMDFLEESRNFREDFEVRKKDDCVKLKAVAAHIRNFSKVSDKQAMLMVGPIGKTLTEKEEVIRNREEIILQMQQQIQELRTQINEHEFQMINPPQPSPQFLLQQQQLQVQQMEFEERGRMLVQLQEQQKQLVSNLDEADDKIYQLNFDLEVENGYLQAEREESNVLRRRLIEEQSARKEAELKTIALQANNEKLQKELQFMTANSQSNSFARIGEKETPILKPMRNIQTTGRPSISRISPPIPRRPQSQGMIFRHNFEEKEVARKYLPETEEIISDEETEGYAVMQATSTPNYRRSAFRGMRGARERDTFRREYDYFDELDHKLLPEPPKFSAAEGSVSMKTFEKAFQMKYERLRPQHQVLLLETRYLTGKALQVFKGIPEGERSCVKSILEAMASRLKMSGPDEKMRAITKWNHLKIQENQSWEDFFLQMDELAQIAWETLTAEQLSVTKTAKLMETIDDPTLRLLLDNKRMEIPQIEHYETCRMLAVRCELSKKERTERDSDRLMGRMNQNDRKNSRFSQNSQKYPQNSAPNYYQHPMQVSQNLQNSSSNPSSYPQNSSSFSQNSVQSVPMNYQRNPHQNSQPMQNPYQNQQTMQNPNTNLQNPQYSQQKSQLQNFQLSSAQTEKDQKNVVTWKDKIAAACEECKQVGKHETTCSRAHKWTKPTEFRCYKCQEEGHMARNCPKLQEEQKSAAPAPQKPAAVQAIVEKEESPILVETNAVEKSESRGSIRVEKGRIGVSEVDLVPDSGACLCLMSLKTWERITAENGKEWARKVKMEYPDLERVFAANDQPMRLLYQVKVETALQSRTREITFYIADLDRESIILGINVFESLGIQMKIEETPRDIVIIKDVRIVPSSEKIVEVQIEGVVLEDKNHCLVTPIIESLASSVCKVDKEGKAVLKLFNHGNDTLLLRKGQKIAVGELDGFEVIQEKAEYQRILDENFGEISEKSSVVCNVKAENDSENSRLTTLWSHLKRKEKEEHEEVWEVVERFQDIFATNDSELGRTHVIECEIELVEGAEPIRQKPRPIPLAIRPEIRKMLQKMIAQDVIRESKSPWSSPVVLVKKKDGSVRMCIDYRKVNKVVKNNAHPLPHIEATLQSLAGKKIFTTLDLLAGYWQIPLKEESKQITAFAIGSELLEWNVLPFGLVTSPAIFQATMEAVVGEALGKSAFVYVDDLLIASETPEQHVRDLEEILKRIRDSGMKLRANKCHIAQRSVEYLGHKVTPEGVKTEETKVEKMRKFSRPTNAKELLSFLGLVGYYRKFIMNFAQTASVLTPLTSKKSDWKWEEEQENAFQTLLSAVCQTPVLMQPDVNAALEKNRPFLIYTDASRQGVGAVLAQEGEDGEQHPIAFASKALSPAEKRYHITDLEALAMMFALRRFKTIVYGTPVMVLTDHKPLIYLLKGTPLADRLLRWSIEILEFNVKIVYIAGKANAVADALSRGGCPALEAEELEATELSEIINEIRVMEVSEKDGLDTSVWFQWLKEEDEGWKDVIEKLENGEKKGKVKICGIKKEVLIENYILIGKSLRNTEYEGHNRFVVPQKARSELLREAHEGLLAGHFGTEKMIRQLSKRFMWPKMRASIEKWVKSCAKCICTNDFPKLIAPLTPYKTSAPLEIVACDLIDVGLSTQGNRYILTIIDLFTKYGTAVPIPDKKAETVLKAFVERWAIGEGRIPITLLTDQGKEFANGLFEEFNKLLKIRHVMTKGYNSRANGAVERFNKTLMHIMKKKATVPMEWDAQVPYAVYAYNSIAHKTTAESPMFLMNGRDSKGPLFQEGEDAFGINYADMDEYKNLMAQELLKAHKLAKEHASKEYEEYKKLFDKKHKTDERKFPEPGSRVLVEIPSEKLGARCPKLVNKWKGPYRVISCTENSATVTPVLGCSKETLVIPFDNLRIIPAEMRNIPIETVKGRAKKMQGNKNWATCDEIAVKTCPINDDNCSEIFTCRCTRPCGFKMEKNPKIVTTSPTQYHRMMILLEDTPSLMNEAGKLSMLSQKSIPWNTPPPGAATFHALAAQCPTVWLFCQDIPGWSTAFLHVYQKSMESLYGRELLNPAKTLLVLAPGVQLEKVPVKAARKLWLPNAAEATMTLNETLHKTQFHILILVVPVSVEHSDQELWMKLLNEIPVHTDAIMVTQPQSITDHSQIPKFCHLFDRTKRDSGKLSVIPPDAMIPSRQNKQLIHVGDQHSLQTYWRAVQEIMEKEKISWPRYQLEEERRDDKPQPSGPSTSNGYAGRKETNAPKHFAGRKENNPNTRAHPPKRARCSDGGEKPDAFC